MAANKNSVHGDQAANGKRGRSGPRGGDADPSLRAVGTAEVLELLVNQKYKCALTNEPLEPTTAALVHKIPVKRGGPHEISNLAVIDQALVLATSQLSFAEFVEICRKVVAHADRQQD